MNSSHISSPFAKGSHVWWKPYSDAFSGISFKGLTVKCPSCDETGIVITRWVKGPKLKPLYVLHRRGRKICKVTWDQSEKIKSDISISKSDIRSILKKSRSFILFSGGKDSLATLAYLRSLESVSGKELVALYVDTTAGLPKNTEYVKKVCRYLKIGLKILRPKVDYFTLVKKWGIPSFQYRWCCRELKIKPIADYLTTIKGPKVVFDGIRADESRIRKEYLPIWYHPTFKCLSISPIFYWSDQDVVSYIASDGIPKTILHSMGSSTECWCGAYKKETDFRELYELDKDMFRKLARVEKANKNGYTFLYKKGSRISLQDLEERILDEKKREPT